MNSAATNQVWRHFRLASHPQRQPVNRGVIALGVADTTHLFISFNSSIRVRITTLPSSTSSSGISHDIINLLQYSPNRLRAGGGTGLKAHPPSANADAT